MHARVPWDRNSCTKSRVPEEAINLIEKAMNFGSEPPRAPECNRHKWRFRRFRLGLPPRNAINLVLTEILGGSSEVWKSCLRGFLVVLFNLQNNKSITCGDDFSWFQAEGEERHHPQLELDTHLLNQKCQGEKHSKTASNMNLQTSYSCGQSSREVQPPPMGPSLFFHPHCWKETQAPRWQWRNSLCLNLRELVA